MNPIISLKNVSKKFQVSKQDIIVLDNVSLELEKGELISIEGSSGSGKSTLLHIMGLLDEKYQGDILFEGHSLKKMSSSKKSIFHDSCKRPGISFGNHPIRIESSLRSSSQRSFNRLFFRDRIKFLP